MDEKNILKCKEDTCARYEVDSHDFEYSQMRWSHGWGEAGMRSQVSPGEGTSLCLFRERSHHHFSVVVLDFFFLCRGSFISSCISL